MAVLDRHRYLSSMILSLVLLPFLVSCTLGASFGSSGGDCPLPCDNVPDEIVCGSNGQTYRNRCYLHNAYCMSESLFTEAYQGECRSQRRRNICPTPWCPPQHDPVCGSDGRTYENQCSLNNAMCDNESLKTEYRGSCTPVTH